jgi:transcription elongation GreA/GreB family factor
MRCHFRGIIFLTPMPLLKHHVIHAAQRKVDSMIADHKDRISDLRSATVRDEVQETASQSENSRFADIELLDRFSEQAERLEHERDVLGRFDAKEHMDIVQTGAVVLTDQRNFLIGPSIEEFSSDGQEYLGISALAPLYQALEGRRKGDQVTFQGTTYTILDVR